MSEVYDISDLPKLLGKQGGRRNKYGVAAAADRTWRGRVYDSKAEMLRARYLALDAGIMVVEQPRIRLGEDTVYRPDFLCVPREGRPWCEDVKGVVTREFARIVNLWRKYGPCSLRVVEHEGKDRWYISVVEGARREEPDPVIVIKYPGAGGQRSKREAIRRAMLPDVQQFAGACLVQDGVILLSRVAVLDLVRHRRDAWGYAKSTYEKDIATSVASLIGTLQGKKYRWFPHVGGDCA